MLLRSPFRRLQDLVAGPPVEVGEVSAVSGGAATIVLEGGGTVHAKGAATVGQRVYVRGDVIEGPAPTLPVDFVEV